MVIRKDSVYFCFVRKVAQRQSSFEIMDSHYDIDKVFKIKFSESSIQVQYKGIVNDRVTTFVSNFLEDFHSFMKEKFVTKTMKYALIHFKKVKTQGHQKSTENGDKKKTFRQVDLESILQKNHEDKQEDASNKFGKPKLTKEIYSQEKMIKGKNLLTMSAITPFVSTQDHKHKNDLSRSRISSNKNKDNLDSQSFLEKSITETNTDIVQECETKIKQIDEPELDFSFDDLKTDERLLEVYSAFLSKYMEYVQYFNEDDHWSLDTDKDDLKIWRRIDDPFVVRKATIQAQLDPVFLEEIMNDFALAPKWNPMLGIFCFFFACVYFMR